MRAGIAMGREWGIDGEDEGEREIELVRAFSNRDKSGEGDAVNDGGERVSSGTESVESSDDDVVSNRARVSVPLPRGGKLALPGVGEGGTVSLGLPGREPELALCVVWELF